MEKFAIIVAGGSGSRMNTAIPKQFIPIGDKPILMHTIQRFLDYSETITIILVLPKDQMETWHSLCKEYSFNHPIIIAEGGKTRFESVKNGLSKIYTSNGLVAVQDGVRPFVTYKIIKDTYELAQEKGNAIAAVALKDSIRSIDGEKSKSEDRNKFKLIQTPQTFILSELKKAYQTADDPLFTDDASVLEKSGAPIYLAEGSYQNIKITTSEDLLYAEAILKSFNYAG